MKLIRFRCPKCRAHHSAVAAKAGQLFVCTTCFGPIIVPENSDAIATEALIAANIPEPELEAKPPTPRRPVPVDAGRPRHLMVVATPVPPEVPPSPTIEPENKVEPTVPRPTRTPIARVGILAMVAVLASIAAVAILAPRRESPAVATEVKPVGVAEVPMPPPLALIKPEPAPLPVAAAPTPAPVPVVATPSEPPKVVQNDPDRPLTLKRRQMLGQEELRRQLAESPELRVEDGTETTLIALHGVIPPSVQQRPGPSITVLERERIRKSVLDEQRKRRQSQGANEKVAPPLRSAMHVGRLEGAPHDMLAMITTKQPELAPLPWRMGDECHLGRESAEDLQVLSRAIRNLLAKSITQGDTRPNADLLRAALLDEPKAQPEAEATEPQAQAQAQSPEVAPAPTSNKRAKKSRIRTNFLVAAAIPALQQLLMAERTPIRVVLIDVLDQIQGKEAAKAIARLAIFDLAPEVREHALLALRSRSPEDYRPTLLEGLRYPWAPVADHSAEALVALGDREAVAGLVELLDQPDPRAIRLEVRDGKTFRFARTVVQVNHLQNCVLCHAPSSNATEDLVRGRVPSESQPLPPPVEYYANTSPGLFVKAEVTYLRQDFSVTQPVESSGQWPGYQRYDYLVSDREINPRFRPRPMDDLADYSQRGSVLFALRELTGKDLGTTSDRWKSIEVARPKPESPPPPAE